jgi:hypothetical protein
MLGHVKEALMPVLSAGNRRLILVADQDNRLQRIPSINPKAVFINTVIEDFPFDAVVLSASANNEGWTRRSWVNAVVHMAEPVPMVAAETLFPNAFKDGSVKEYVVEHLNGYPLCWGMAEAVALTPDTLGSLNGVVEERLYSVVIPYRRALNASSDCQDEFVGALHSRMPQPLRPDVYERNLLEIGKVAAGFLLMPIFHEAMTYLRARFPLTVSALCRLRRPEVLELSLLTIMSRLVPVGRPEMPIIYLRESCFRLDELPPPSSEDVTCVMATCRGAQFVDMYVLRVHHRSIELLVVQCTLNNYHSDSFMSFRKEKLNFLKGKTMIQHCIETLTKKYQIDLPISVNFVWVTEDTQRTLDLGNGRILGGALPSNPKEAIKGVHPTKYSEYCVPDNSLLKLLLERTKSELFMNDCVKIEKYVLRELHLLISYEGAKGLAISLLDEVRRGHR